MPKRSASPAAEDPKSRRTTASRARSDGAEPNPPPPRTRSRATSGSESAPSNSGGARGGFDSANAPTSPEDAPHLFLASPPLRASGADGHETEVEGVFLTPSGRRVDERGVSLTWSAARETEAAAAQRILGEPLDSPAKLLKYVALNPTLPLAVRVDAAAKAAPYYDMKMPLRVEGDLGAETRGLIDAAALGKLSREEREALLSALRKLGAMPT